jgi:hypothetical protein
MSTVVHFSLPLRNAPINTIRVGMPERAWARPSALPSNRTQGPDVAQLFEFIGIVFPDEKYSKPGRIGQC